MKFLFSLVMLAMSSTALGLSCTDPKDLEDCVYETSFIMNRGVSIPSTIDELKNHCKRGEKSLNCLIEFTDKCVMGPPKISLKRVYTTVQRGMGERCGNDDKLQEFADHLKCLQDESKIEMVRKCSDKHIKHLEQVIDIEGMQRTGPLCCIFKYFHDCIKGVVDEQCGEDVGEYFENLINEYKDELLMTMCEKFSDLDKCAANLPSNVWTPMKAIIDRTDRIEHNYKTTIPIMFRLLDKFIKKN